MEDQGKNELENRETNRRYLDQTTNDGAENASRYAEIASSCGWQRRVNHAIKHIEKDSDLDENLLAYLLECVITTVICMASDQAVPHEYLHCSLAYLQHIKNEFGENPPNIEAFMELITSKLPQEDREMHQNLKEPAPSSIVVTRLPKSLQKTQFK